MIGDRKFDIEGARHFGVDSVGVTYGYANDGELTKAGATYLAEDPQAVASLITGEKAISEVCGYELSEKDTGDPCATCRLLADPACCL